MTFKSWLGKQLRDALESPPPPPPPNPASTPTSPTRNGRTSGSTSAGLDVLQVLEIVREMQTAMMTEMRGMVMDILQGREMPAGSPELGQGLTTEQVEEQVKARASQFDAPNYDAEGIEDLPPELQGVFQRQDREQVEFRTSLTEPELQNEQLARARLAAGLDPQGPTPGASSSPDSASLGLRWAAQDLEQR